MLRLHEATTENLKLFTHNTLLRAALFKYLEKAESPFPFSPINFDKFKKYLKKTHQSNLIDEVDRMKNAIVEWRISINHTANNNNYLANKMPANATNKILSHLSYKDINQLRGTCSFFKSINLGIYDKPKAKGMDYTTLVSSQIYNNLHPPALKNYQLLELNNKYVVTTFHPELVTDGFWVWNKDNGTRRHEWPLNYIWQMIPRPDGRLIMTRAALYERDNFIFNQDVVLIEEYVKGDYYNSFYHGNDLVKVHNQSSRNCIYITNKDKPLYSKDIPDPGTAVFPVVIVNECFALPDNKFLITLPESNRVLIFDRNKDLFTPLLFDATAKKLNTIKVSTYGDIFIGIDNAVHIYDGQTLERKAILDCGCEVAAISIINDNKILVHATIHPPRLGADNPTNPVYQYNFKVEDNKRVLVWEFKRLEDDHKVSNAVKIHPKPETLSGIFTEKVFQGMIEKKIDVSPTISMRL